MNTGFVNYAGDPVLLDPSRHAKAKAKAEPKSSHNGWRVVGIPPGCMEAARAKHEQERIEALERQAKEKAMKIPQPWNEDFWRSNFKKPAVRSKPYEIPQAAKDCKELAERCGWTFIDIVEIKKEVRGS